MADGLRRYRATFYVAPVSSEGSERWEYRELKAHGRKDALEQARGLMKHYLWCHTRQKGNDFDSLIPEERVTLVVVDEETDYGRMRE